MADNLGNSAESFSQKRSWVSCHSSEINPSHSRTAQELEPPIPFSKRSRSEQEFLDCEAHSAKPKSDQAQLTTVTVDDKSNPIPSACVPHISHEAKDGQHTAVAFTIGDVEEMINHVEKTADETHEHVICKKRDDCGNAGLSQSEEDEDSSDVSEISDISIEGSGWRPMAGPMSWVQNQIAMGVDPRQILKHILPHQTSIPEDVDQLMLWKLIINIVSEPGRRKKLDDVNTLEHVVELIINCKKILVLTGAGVSVSCGIPDFRSRDGIYARLSVEYPDLPDQQAMFDINYFKNNQKPFFKFAKEIYPGQFEPSTSHKFIRLIESHDQLLRNYTQNIDTLEQVAGIKNVIQCHGSFATATCMICKYKTDAEGVREDIMNQIIPRCPKCPRDEPLSVLKPDIVFFGESLPNEFHDQMELDKDVCDLLIVIGSSLKVRPVALIPNSLPAHIPQVLINREPLKHLSFDVELLGDCDIIVEELCKRLGTSWQSVCSSTTPSTQIIREDMSTPSLGSQRSPPHLPTPPNSEESTRMSFQLGSDDNSHMSTQDVDSVSRSPQIQSSDLPTATTGNAPLCPVSEETCMSFGDDDSRQGPSDVTTANVTLSESNSMATLTSRTRAMSTSNELESEKEDHAIENIPTSCDDWSTGPPSQSELELLRACWQPKVFNLASKLKENTFLFLPPNRYVFKGAEVYNDLNSDSESDVDADSSCAVDDLNDIEQDSGVVSSKDVTASENLHNEFCTHNNDKSSLSLDDENTHLR